VKEVVVMLKGDLSTTPLAPLLLDLARDTATGCLVIVADDDDEAQLYLKQGLVYAVQVPGARPQLGSKLVSSGALAPEALADALEAQRTELQGWRLGELLVHLGYVEQTVVEAFVKEQVNDAMWDLMRWHSGRWRFRKNVKTREDVAPPMEVVDLLSVLRERGYEWETISAVVHGPSAIPVLSTGGVANPETVLDPEAWSMLCKIDGERSVADLARDCGYTLFEAGHVIVSLVRAGLVDIEEDIDVAGQTPYGATTLASAWQDNTDSAEGGRAWYDEPDATPATDDAEGDALSRLARLVTEVAGGQPASETEAERAPTPDRALAQPWTRGVEPDESFAVALAKVSSALIDVLGPAETEAVDPFDLPRGLRKPQKHPASDKAEDPEWNRRAKLRSAAAAELAAAHALAEALRPSDEDHKRPAPEAEAIADDAAEETARLAAEAEEAEAARLVAEADEAARVAAEEEAARLAAEAEAEAAARLAAEAEAEEAARVAAEEAARLAAEADAAEAARVAEEEEAARAAAEAEAAEVARIAAEAEAAEAARLVAEAEEAARVAAEAEAAEAARVAAEEEEAARIAAEAEEAARVAAEEEAAEAARLAAEAEEAARLAAEAEAAEQARVAAEEEAARIAAEAEAEAEAEAAEAARLAAEAEAERVAAEEEAARVAAEEELAQLAAEEEAEAARLAAEAEFAQLAAEEEASAVAVAAEAARLEAEQEAAREAEVEDAEADAARRAADALELDESDLRAAEAAALLGQLSAEPLSAVMHPAAEADVDEDDEDVDREADNDDDLYPMQRNEDMADTAALLRELSSLGTEDSDSDTTSGPPQSPRPAPRPANGSDKKQRKKIGLFGL
jgi:hypothetical protein